MDRAGGHLAPKPGFRGHFIFFFAFIVISLISPTIATASDLVFGPITCLRGTGAPTVFEYSFAAPEPSRGFIFKVYNGGLEDTTYELVSSSVITLNGAEILGPNNFNQQTAYVEIPVFLQAQNTLSVEVRGKSGGALIIKVFPFVVIDTLSVRTFLCSAMREFPCSGQTHTRLGYRDHGEESPDGLGVGEIGLARAQNGSPIQLGVRDVK